MTVIAWDGKTLASDRRGTCGDHARPVKKIFKIWGNKMVGISGNLSVGQEMLEWYKRGAKVEEYPSSNRSFEDGCTLIVITHEHIGKTRVDIYESSPYPSEIFDLPVGFGSGGAAASCAMEHGATAEEAVRTVSKYLPSCGNGVDVLTF